MQVALYEAIEASIEAAAQGHPSPRGSAIWYVDNEDEIFGMKIPAICYIWPVSGIPHGKHA